MLTAARGATIRDRDGLGGNGTTWERAGGGDVMESLEKDGTEPLEKGRDGLGIYGTAVGFASSLGARPRKSLYIAASWRVVAESALNSLPLPTRLFFNTYTSSPDVRQVRLRSIRMHVFFLWST